VNDFSKVRWKVLQINNCLTCSELWQKTIIVELLTEIDKIDISIVILAALKR
jgi:hypothetical protein